MRKIVIFQWNLASAIDYKPRRIRKIPPLPVHMELLANDQNADLLVQIGKDPLLHQRLVDICKEVFSESAKRLEAFLKNWDESPRGRVAPGPGVPAGADETEGLKRLDEKYKSEEKTSQQVVKQEWEALLKSLGEEREQYKRYKKEVTIKVTMGTFGFLAAVAVVGVTAAMTGGVSALAIVGLWRSIAKGLKTILDLHEEAEGIQRRLERRLKTLWERFDQKKKSRAWGITKDAGWAMVNDFLPLQRANIDTAKYDAGLLKNKLCHIRDQAHELSENLNELLDKTEDLDKQYWDRTFVGPNAQAAKTRAERAYQKMTEQVILWLEEIPKLHLRAENGIPRAEALRKELAQLQTNVPGWVQRFENLFPLLVSLGLAVGGINEAVHAEILAEKAVEGVDAGNDVVEVLVEGSEKVGEMLVERGEKLEEAA